MRTLFRSFRNRRAFVAGCFTLALFAAPFLPTTASTGDQQKSIGTSADSEGSPPSRSHPKGRSTGSTPRWIVSADAIVLGRIGGSASQTLVSQVSGGEPFGLTSILPGTEALNSNQFRQGYSAGPNIALIYHDDSGHGAELSYFNIFDQSATKAIGPDGQWLVMKAPGNFFQTQDFADQAMAWKSTTNLYNAEANGRWDLSSRVTVLAGLRWLQLNDTLQGTLTPADLTEPTWKISCTITTCKLSEIPPNQLTPGTPVPNNPPFWNTSTTNNLYGIQIGADARLLERGRFSLDGLIKTGIFDNDAEQSTGVSIRKSVYPSQATTDHAAFVGEGGVQLKYRVLKGLALKAGYKALWLDGVALAPGQIQETSSISTSTESTVRALGVNCGSGVLFQGATAGLEYSF